MVERRDSCSVRDETVWVVDDADAVRKALARGLERVGFNVVNLIASAEEALRQIEFAHPSLIIQDVKLGDGIDGIDVSRIIRSKGYRGKILIYTGDTSHETLFRAALAGANDYIVKPESNELICREARRVLDGRKRAEPLPEHHESFREGAYVRSRNVSEFEIELLSEICRDYPTQIELAQRLGRTPSQVRKETESIRRKLGCKHYGQLTHLMAILEIFSRRAIEDVQYLVAAP